MVRRRHQQKGKKDRGTIKPPSYKKRRSKYFSIIPPKVSPEQLDVKKARSRQAIALAIESRWEDAIIDNQAFIRDYPADVEAYNRLGTALTELGREYAAQEAFRAALLRSPENVIARKHLNKLLGYPDNQNDRRAVSDLIDVDTLGWELLPPGWWGDSTRVKEIKRHFETQREFDEFIGRLTFADGFNPLQRYGSKFGSAGYTYYIFVYRNHVLAECPQYGNAAYVLKGTNRWQSIFKLSRREVRTRFSDRIVRILHTTTWKERLAQYLN